MNIYFVGEATNIPAIGNQKLIADWYSNNSKKAVLAGEYNNLLVSSWACVIDIWWKKDFAPVRNGNIIPTTIPITY